MSSALAGGSAMTRAGEIRDLYAFNGWANARMLEAAGHLTAEEVARDLGSSFPSIRDTLEHIVQCEWVWVCRWRGESPRELPPGWEGGDLARIGARFEEIRSAQEAFVGALAEPALDEIIAYTSWGGQRFTAPLWQLLRNVVNHSSYHRGQLATMLRQLGASAPGTDLVVYHRTVAPPMATS